MSRVVTGSIALGIVVAVGAGVRALTVNDAMSTLPRAKVVLSSGGAPLCPWRNPEQDLQAVFGPGATTHREVRILSAQLLPLTQRLGRAPAPEERAVYLERVTRGGNSLGTVVVRRVKGEYGAVELVMAVGTDGKVLAVRIQRSREPEAISEEIHSSAWLNAFRGKSAADSWRLREDIPDVSVQSRPTARALIAGVRATLILLEVAEQSGVVSHHHH